MQKNNRNSRDDKSKDTNRTSRRPSGPSEKTNRHQAESSEGSNTSSKKLFGDGAKKSFAKPGESTRKRDDDRKPFAKRDDDRKPFAKRDDDRKPFTKRDDDRKPFTKRDDDRKPYGSRDDAKKTGKPFGSFEKKSSTGFDKSKPAPYGTRGSDKKEGKFEKDRPSSGKSDQPFRKREPEAKRTPRTGERKRTGSEDTFDRKPTLRPKKPASAAKDDGLIRLNRYISNAGICSRRKADELIEAGVISVNGQPVSELGYKVDPRKDIIRYNGEVLKREKLVYVLLNKPKDYITTTDDPQERHTVMHLVDKASNERIYPVGRLDRNTTGLLLMTNDGELTDKLSHPKNNITKIYQIELNKALTQGDLNKIQFGLELEDGPIKPDAVNYVQGGSKREIGIQIHSGKNRIVRRIFEHLGYEVVKLDRVVYANLTKKDLPRGRWRYLEEKEVIQLKHLI